MGIFHRFDQAIAVFIGGVEPPLQGHRGSRFLPRDRTIVIDVGVAGADLVTSGRCDHCYQTHCHDHDQSAHRFILAYQFAGLATGPRQTLCQQYI
jgi:hypothetical protein